jgi:hypothetical protein
VNEFFGLIWDDAEEMARLARLSHPRVVLDTAGLSPEATALANRLARDIRKLPPETIRALLQTLDGGSTPMPPPGPKLGPGPRHK